MDKQQQVYQQLEQLGIAYEAVQHPAAFTIEEIEALDIPNKDAVAKNLFLRDAKGRRHFLVVLRKDKQADLLKLQDELCCSKLSFASEKRLEMLLGLTKGSVTPLGVLHDSSCDVEVAIDQDLIAHKKIGVHPNDNTATVFLSFEDLKKVIVHSGNMLHIIQL